MGQNYGSQEEYLTSQLLSPEDLIWSLQDRLCTGLIQLPIKGDLSYVSSAEPYPMVPGLSALVINALDSLGVPLLLAVSEISDWAGIHMAT